MWILGEDVVENRVRKETDLGYSPSGPLLRSARSPNRCGSH